MWLWLVKRNVSVKSVNHLFVKESVLVGCKALLSYFAETRQIREYTPEDASLDPDRYKFISYVKICCLEILCLEIIIVYLYNCKPVDLCVCFNLFWGSFWGMTVSCHVSQVSQNNLLLQNNLFPME
jgi:hypothetical protein